MKDMDITEELALYEALAEDEGFKLFCECVAEIEVRELTIAVEAKTPREETVALKTAKGLRIALDFVPNKIAELKREIEREIERAKKEEEEAKRRLL